MTKIKKSIPHTSPGTVIDMVASIFTLMAIGVILIFYISWSANIEGKASINRIARKYLLQMETVGCLVNTAGLVSELESAGVSGISLTGTTTAPQTYGAPIYLTIHGSMAVQSVGFDPTGWQMTSVTSSIPISITLTSTAKS